ARPGAAEGSAPRARERCGRGARRPRQDRRDGGPGPGHGRADPRPRQGERSDALAEDLVRHARVRERRQGRLLLPERAEVQGPLRHVRLHRRREPRRRRDLADLLRPEGVDPRRGGPDRRTPEEGDVLRAAYVRRDPTPTPGPPPEPFLRPGAPAARPTPAL